jgi:5-methylcytosine-specific restriction endonuclease McrA
MEKSDFFAQYKSPLWQRKRLEIMERDNFKCCDCQSDDKTLNVHHKYYIYGKKPWEYADGILITLCEDCHKRWEYDKSIINDFTRVLLAEGWSPSQLDTMLSIFRQLTPIRKDIEQIKVLIHRIVYEKYGIHIKYDV